MTTLRPYSQTASPGREPNFWMVRSPLYRHRFECEVSIESACRGLQTITIPKISDPKWSPRSLFVSTFPFHASVHLNRYIVSGNAFSVPKRAIVWPGMHFERPETHFRYREDADEDASAPTDNLQASSKAHPYLAIPSLSVSSGLSSLNFCRSGAPMSSANNGQKMTRKKTIFHSLFSLEKISR